jgi:uncharacterized protein (TIGR02996 family)
MARPRKPKSDVAPFPPGWEPFLAAIRAAIEDDIPRLVFADWLQENGEEERAELIRLQCELARAAHDDPNNSSRQRRIDELLNTNWDNWVAGFPGWVQRDRFRHQFVRGFISSISTTSRRFLRDADALTGLTALVNLELTSPTAEALQSEFLARVGGLHLDPVDSASISALASNLNLQLFRHLHVDTGRDSRGLPPRTHVNRQAIQRLFANPTLTGLKQFSLNGPPHGDAVACGLAEGKFTSLEQLDLVDSRLTAEGLSDIVGSPSCASLRGLYIAGNHFGDAGIRHLVGAPGLSQLECLNCIDCGLTGESAKMLAEWPGLRSVQWLQVGTNGLMESDIEHIRSSPHAISLADLGAYS